MGIETPLDIMSITLQNKRESNQNNSSKQSASTTPPLVKYIKPQILKLLIKIRIEGPASLWAYKIQDFEK